MKAMVLPRTVSLDATDSPLQLEDVLTPNPQSGEVLVRVSACGVCHTELDEIEGRTAPPGLPIILGHEVVGRVAELGSGVTKHLKGDRVGVGWIHSSTGDEYENLSPDFRATGRDANGGYAEYMTVPADYAYPIPEVFSDEHAAPLLCAGAIGYRALRLTNMQDGQRLGLTGFGGSAHLVIQLAHCMFPNSEGTSSLVMMKSARSPASLAQCGLATQRTGPLNVFTPSSTQRRFGSPSSKP